jgi:hypothetical protein
MNPLKDLPIIKYFKIISFLNIYGLLVLYSSEPMSVLTTLCLFNEEWEG